MSYLGTKPSNQTPTYKQVYEYTATAGQTTFTASYTVGFVEVIRNGVKLGSPDFTATNGTSVVLTNGCTAGDFVRIESVFTANVQGAIPNTAGAVVTSNIADANVTQAKLAANVAGNGPAFHAYQSTQQTGISAGVFTKVNLQTEEFDTNNCFNPSTSTFTPNVAGYYQVNCTVWTQSPTSGTILAGFVNLWKNGAWIKDGNFSFYPSGLNETGSTLSTLVYMNGTTDYLQMYIWGNTTSGNFNLYNSAVSQRIHFSASLVRAA